MIKGKISVVMLVAFLLLASIAYTGMVGNVAATDPVTVTVSVPKHVSGSFEATIEVEDVSNLNAGQFDLIFDPTVVNVRDVVDGEIDGVTIPIDGWELMSEDTLRVLFKLPGVENASGSGCLAKILFEVKGGDGDTSELVISDGLLVDLNSYGMDAYWMDAAVTVAIGPLVTVNAPDTVSDSFEVQIGIDNVKDIDAAQFDLSFDPDLLTATSVSDGEINGIAVPVLNWNLDPDDPGKLRVVLDLPGVDGVSGSGYLARIGFDPVGDGVSELLLGNVILSDVNAEAIRGVQLKSSEVKVSLPGKTVISIRDVAAIGTITVPIMVENATNVGSCDLTLSYDPLIAIVSDVDGGDFDSLEANLEDTSDGSVRIGTYQTSSSGLNGDVVLAEVTFMTMGEVGTLTVLDLEVTTLKDATPECNPIPCLVEDGSFTVLLKGDANNDGRMIDMADCMYLAKHILEIVGFEELK
jgi:hypothetical protein